jgi:hypothetical protein
MDILVPMNRGQWLAWGSVGFLVLIGVGAAILGLLTASRSIPASASAQLTAAMSATNNASSYVLVINDHPGEESIFNSPNLNETIVGGHVSEIWAGKTMYNAVSESCGGKVRFIEAQPQGTATSEFVGFGRDTVNQHGATFIVSSDGRQFGRYLVRNGHVVKITESLAAIRHSNGAAVTESFTRIGHAPRIVVPAASEVTTSPRLYFHGCPL